MSIEPPLLLAGKSRLYAAGRVACHWVACDNDSVFYLSVRWTVPARAPMILCVTLNPCLDKTLTIPFWHPGELIRGTSRARGGGRQGQ